MSRVGEEKEVISVTGASLDQLILMVHNHGQRCPLTPSLQSEPRGQEVKMSMLEEDPEIYTRSAEAEMCLMYVCEGGHVFTWRTHHAERNDERNRQQGSAAPAGQRKTSERQRNGVKKEVCKMRSRRKSREKPVSEGNTTGLGETEQVTPAASGENKEAGNESDLHISLFLTSFMIS